MDDTSLYGEQKIRLSNEVGNSERLKFRARYWKKSIDRSFEMTDPNFSRWNFGTLTDYRKICGVTYTFWHCTTQICAVNKRWGQNVSPWGQPYGEISQYSSSQTALRWPSKAIVTGRDRFSRGKYCENYKSHKTGHYTYKVILVSLVTMSCGIYLRGAVHVLGLGLETCLRLGVGRK